MEKILFLVPYPFDEAPSQRLKFEQYFPIIKEHGYSISFHSFISKEFGKIVHKKGFLFSKIKHTILGYLNLCWLLFSIRKYDIVYTHLWITPFGFPLFEWIVRQLTKKLIYDIDDLVYLNQESKINPFLSMLKGQKKVLYLMKVADHVITCTPYLDNFVRNFNNHTTDISSTVDTDKRYKVVNEYTNDKDIIIGWSGSHSSIRYYFLLENIFKKIQQKYPTVKFRVLGIREVNMGGLNIESIEWQETIEMKILQTFDIGVYPMQKERWAYGKSGLKAIQYMALGIPTIATAFGTNFRVIEDGVSGFLVDTETEWIKKLSLLIERPDLRRKIGMEGRRKSGKRVFSKC